jgi:Zn-dependent protease
MDALGPFALISLFYLALGVRVVFQLARSWRTVFDRTFTPAERGLVDQAAFFLLVPVSVALHELGHAAAITALGGRVLSWGYYGFAGFVGYDPRQFSDPEQIVIAAAGTLVNLALAATALGLVFLRRPPMRAAFNELLIQFVVVSLVNALVVYPLLDVLTGLNGDWTQMYDGGVPALSLTILAFHVAILGGLWWAWRDEGIRARVATLTGAPALRTVRLRRGGHAGGAPVAPGASAEEHLLSEAAERVASGWLARSRRASRRRRTGRCSCSPGRAVASSVPSWRGLPEASSTSPGSPWSTATRRSAGRSGERAPSPTPTA